jgi:hypothetical protein
LAVTLKAEPATGSTAWAAGTLAQRAIEATSKRGVLCMVELPAAMGEAVSGNGPEPVVILPRRGLRRDGGLLTLPCRGTTYAQTDRQVRDA